MSAKAAAEVVKRIADEPLVVVGVAPDVGQVVDGGAKFVVQSGDALKVISDTASSADVWVSAVDAIST